MKTKHALVLAASCACIPLPTAFGDQSNTQADAAPTGTLTVSNTMVRNGVRPMLSWNITYPPVLVNHVTVIPPGTVKTKENLICDVRVIGAGVTAKSSNSSNYTFVRTEGRMRVGGSSAWTTIFDGVNTDQKVQTQQIAKSFNVTAGQTIDFGGRYYWYGYGPLYTSADCDNVRTLMNGATPPSNVPSYNAPSLANFLKPYLDSQGKVRIGPMDVIVFMELTHTDPNNPGYDLQDLVLLVTFRKS